MTDFDGFGGDESFTPLPDSFFRRLLNEISDADELKVTLYLLWRLTNIEGAYHTLCRSEMLEDERFLAGLGEAGLDAGLEKAVRRGSLLRVEGSGGGFYLLNTPRGRAAAQAMARGDWRESARVSPPPPADKPNIFKLYEQNIGPLTPMIADMLRDAEKTYPEAWIEEAMAEAVRQNKRNWKYVEAILKRWKDEGRGQKQDRPDTDEDRRRDDQRKLEEFLRGK